MNKSLFRFLTKKILFFLFFILIYFRLEGQNIFLKKIDNSEKIHYSYENKLGELKNGWLEEETIRIPANKPKRIILDRNFQIFPFILFPDDTLKVSLKKNIPTVSNNNPDWAFYKQLEDKYKIIMSPFSGIDYTEKTSYDIIYSEIQNMRQNRLTFLRNAKVSQKYFDIYELLIEARFIDELKSPYYKLTFATKILPESYIEKIEKDTDDFLDKFKNNKNIELVYNFLWGIVQFKCRAFENNETKGRKQFEYIMKNFDSEARNYLMLKVINKTIEEGNEITNLLPMFFELCKDADYTKYLQKNKIIKDQLSIDENVKKESFNDLLGSATTWGKILESNLGKVVYVDFWASWCKPCIEFMPITKNLEKTINNPQFKIIYLNIDDTTDKWEETLNKYQLNMNPVVHFRLINQDSFLAKTMDLQAIPRFLLINKDGIIINDNAPSPINPALVQTIKRLLN